MMIDHYKKENEKQKPRNKEEAFVQVLEENGYIELSDPDRGLGIETTGDIRIFEQDYMQHASDCDRMCMILGKGNDAWFLWFRDDEEGYNSKVGSMFDRIEDEFADYYSNKERS